MDRLRRRASTSGRRLPTGKRPWGSLGWAGAGKASALLLGTAVACAVLGPAPSPVAAQVDVPRPAAPEGRAGRGWVGISYDLRADARGTVVVYVTEVADGSPAAEAGVQVGDRILSINGRDASTNFGNAALSIRPGDAVRMLLLRGDRRVPVRLRAAARPDEPGWSSTVTVTVTSDSIADAMFRAMDSLRLTLVARRGAVAAADSLELTLLPGTRPARVRAAPEPTEAGQTLIVSEVRAPFGFWVFETRAADSLRRAMEAFNEEVRALRTRERSRLAPLVDPVGRLVVTDSGLHLGELRETLKAMAERSASLQSAVDRAAEEAARARRYAVAGDEVEAVTPAEEPPVFTPLTPYLLGQNRVAGAELMDLRAELAEVFEVRGGVLVTDVVPGTPMALADIHAGDVITHVDQVSIRSVPELRLALSRAREAVPLTLVRKGSALQVLLRR